MTYTFRTITCIITAAVLTLSLVLCAVPVSPVNAEESVHQKLSAPVLMDDTAVAQTAQKLNITLSGFGYLPQLVDGDQETYNSITDGKTIIITTDSEMAYLYVKWRSNPNVWTLSYNDTSVECGQNGFKHELIRLPEGVTEVSMTIHCDSWISISEIEAYSAGSLPDNVQDWQPPCEKADLLVLPTHSDDEFVFLGGVIPKYVDAGYAVQVAYLVDHRVHERLDSLWEAGIRNYPIVSIKEDVYFSSYEDTARFFNRNYTNAYLTQQIRRFQPSVIVGQAEDGDSGHFAHIFYVGCLKEAVELAADAGYVPEGCEGLEVWNTPKTYLHRYGDNPLVLDFETPLDSFGGRTAFQVALDAFQKCTTQAQIGKYTVYGSDSKHDSHLFGLYRSTVGEDVLRNDLFENIQ